LRRVTIVAVRSMIVLLLLAAALDAPLPRRTADRVRVHLIDRSKSVTLKGPKDSLKLEDVDAIVAHDRDRKASGDTVTWASFGKTLAWESSAVDDSGTALEMALTTVLGREPTEIILYTDGRGDPGDALTLCRLRGIPVHVLPIGPLSVRDVRFRRIHAPASVRAGERCTIEVAVESTYDVSCTVAVDADVRPVTLTAGVAALLEFPRTGPGHFVVSIGADDDCRENNKAEGDIFEISDRPKVLALSEGLSLPGVDLKVLQKMPALAGFDAVILDNVVLPPADQQTLADYVRSGGGLVLLGGPKSYALADWQKGPLEAISPVKVKPDLKVAVVLGIDSSGSMGTVFDRAIRAILDVRQRFDADDDVVAMTFADDAQILNPDALRKVTPTGGTRIARGIDEAARYLRPKTAGRKMIVLMTDGESSAEETPEMIQRAIAGLLDIGLVVITTHKDVPGADNKHIDDWAGLQARLQQVTDTMQDLIRKTPGILDLRTHPVTAGVQPVVVKDVNRTTAKSDAQVLATVGQAPAQDPVLVLRAAGDGRVAAFTIGYEPALSRLFAQALDAVIGDRAEGLTLSVDPPLVLAQGDARASEFTTEGFRVEMKQVGPHRWEGRLPPDLAGTVLVRKGRAKATATIPCPPEFSALGVDRAALDRIARETGGRVLTSPELGSLPRPERTPPRSGRTLFLIAALVLVFVELGVSIYWKV
jgi:hypothetical protein